MKIASQIRIISLGLVLSTAVLIGVVVYWGFHTLGEGQQRERLEQVVLLEIERLKTAFLEIHHDIGFLAEVPSISKIIQAQRDQRFSVEQHEKANLAILFKEVLKTKPYYDQIRLIGIANQGKEIIRVERNPNGIFIVKESDLQQKGTNDYFIKTLQNPPGQAYFSKINLNREHGSIEQPYRPMLRAALPIYQSNDQLFGIVIINMNFKNFIDELFRTRSERYTYFLTNPDGDFLVHPESSHTFGFDLGKSFLAQEEYPVLSPLYGASDQEFVTHWQDLSIFNPILIHFRKARIFHDDLERFLVFGVSASFRDVQANAHVIMLKVLGITVLLILISLALTFFLTTRLTKPLEWLTQSTHRFAKGLAIPSRPNDPKNEIGLLSVAFDHMVASIKEKENQVASMNHRLLQTNTDLEHFVHIASHNLREPARRMFVLADLIGHEGKEGISPESQDLLLQIQAASVNFLDQMTDFRVFSNITQGTLLRTNINMENLIRSVTEEFTYAFQLRKTSFSIAPFPSLNVYENLVRVLYKNLLDQILKYAHCDDFMISFTAEQAAGQWTLGLWTTGTSIDQKNLAKVFTPLNQTTSFSSELELDLAICKRIIERHTGKIWMEINEDIMHIRFTFGKEASNHERHDNDQ
ncbi:MAG: ATP-binding protein [Nitrospirales bacterium]